jgi:hypothetical protein
MMCDVSLQFELDAVQVVQYLLDGNAAEGRVECGHILAELPQRRLFLWAESAPELGPESAVGSVIATRWALLESIHLELEAVNVVADRFREVIVRVEGAQFLDFILETLHLIVEFLPEQRKDLSRRELAFQARDLEFEATNVVRDCSRNNRTIIRGGTLQSTNLELQCGDVGRLLLNRTKGLADRPEFPLN